MLTFTGLIFKALAARKFSDKEIRDAISASATRFAALKRGQFELTDREVFYIERMSGRSGGQLAYQGSGIKDAAYAKVVNAWAKVARVGPNDEYESSKPRKSRAARRPARSPVPARAALVRGVQA